MVHLRELRNQSAADERHRYGVEVVLTITADERNRHGVEVVLTITAIEAGGWLCSGNWGV
jgi:hypothetical protein